MNFAQVFVYARPLGVAVAACAVSLVCVASAAAAVDLARPDAGAATRLADWPRLKSAIPADPAMEARIRDIVAGMTLPQKIGQMTQPEIKSITPDEVRRYYIGSVLNGGGSWPNKDKHARVEDWLALATRYHDASMNTDMVVKIPVIWGTDAVHGHSNVFGATIFPHNIGLGAARDPNLIEEIAAATGKAVRATGVQWVFAPTLAVAQDARWGRTYESFSDDAELVKSYAARYTRGLQGRFADDANAVATAKHFMGDGGTANGKDQGVTVASRQTMMNVHGKGYYGAIAAGAQTVMASFNSWREPAGTDHGKMHGNKELLSDALKHKMGFDGFVVSDWNGIAQVPGCADASCPQAINAGIDMVMVPDEWRNFIANTIRQVESGEIPMARIDDAVTRILRVKMRAGLFAAAPAANRYAGKSEAVVSRELARKAVARTLVLLKNNDRVLPLRTNQRILVVGKNAHNLQNQTGGWTLTWQGTQNTNADFPFADSILDGVRERAGADKVVFSEKAAGVDPRDFDVIVAVIGETPYAEGQGDIGPADTVRHSRRYPEDLAVLRSVAGKGRPVVTVFLSGRPVYANDLLNLSGAFVAAWLPGTEGKGVTDVLFLKASGDHALDFRGRLPFAWPAADCASAEGLVKPLFRRGYGLTYRSREPVASLPEMQSAACAALERLAVFPAGTQGGFSLIASDAAGNVLGPALNAELAAELLLPRNDPLLRVDSAQIHTQHDARRVAWLGTARLAARAASPVDLVEFAKRGGALKFDVVVTQAPVERVTISMQCGAGCKGAVDATAVLRDAAGKGTRTIVVPLHCFARSGADLSKVDAPFAIDAAKPFAAAFTRIEVVIGAAADAGALPCPAL